MNNAESNKQEETFGVKEINKFNRFYEKQVLNNKNNFNKDFNSNSVLITSSFGNGKTTLKNNFKEKLLDNNKENEKIFVLDINLWMHENKNPSHVFFMELFDVIDITKTSIKDKAIDSLQDFLKKKFPKIDKMTDILFNSKTKDQYGIIKQEYYFEEVFNDYLDFLNENNIHIYFLLDELDRCSKNYIIKFFSSLKTILNHQNIYVFTFANEKYLEELFNRNSYSESYISKFFNHRYEIIPEPLYYLKKLIFDKFGFNIIGLSTHEMPTYKNLFEKLFYNNVSYREINESKLNIDKFLEYFKKDETYIYIRTLNGLNFFFYLLFYLIKNGLIITNETHQKTIEKFNIINIFEESEINNEFYKEMENIGYDYGGQNFLDSAEVLFSKVFFNGEKE